MREIRVYIEGGNSKTNDEFRKAFRTFLKEIDEMAQARGFILRPIMAGPRSRAYEEFCRAVQGEPEHLHLLLVDAEEAVQELGESWKHLKWVCPEGVDDTHCHLMVMAMEAWFFADPDALEDFYGREFNRKALPTTANVEKIAKREHIRKLNSAVKNTPKREYHKAKHAPELIKRLDVGKVRGRAPHCELMFKTLADKIEAQP